MSEPVLVADCVGKRFGNRWVLRSASLRAVPGQLRAFVGRNGAGKSTLMKIAVGLTSADSGMVHFAGQPRLRPRLHQFAREGLFLLPDYDVLSGAFTIREHLRFVSAPDEDSMAIAKALGIESLLDARPFELSSGERRRAELAFAWQRRPRCLLADEPLRNISPIDGEVVLRTLRSMAEAGCAVIVTGHEIHALLSFAHHVTWCTEGTTYELGPPFMARADERFRRAYMGPGKPFGTMLAE